ncbi:fatty acid desaturase family protein [Psychrobacter sp. Sarcosine-3u-12]|uniref:fatty acid desaturase family protein n=1 Tax=Psychrobacter sp. Sarcosine-3u-12 TaxID=2058325 RepID=UPI000C333640|nr:acyl-CoA desaturase [Psychrobacter sp. Sarcosine-3u-12]PKG34612.1 acyl-CoA desaturase [Psychrobacter sp. Sarcosine-3u-12]
MRLLPPMFTAQSAVPTFAGLTNLSPKQGLYPTLSGAQLPTARTEALAAELNTLYQSVMDSLGADDARYIQRVYSTVVYSEILARGLLAVSGRLSSRQSRVVTWLLGTSLLSFSKILNNMELGHNVMHGQYDWMQHPHLNSKQFDWDIVCPAPLWQHSHNYLHHTYTNIVGRDHDVGYHLIRVTDEQPWTPSDRYNLLKTMILALGFEWAVAFHDIQISVDEYAESPQLTEIMQPKSHALLSKIARQVGKDHLVFPTLASLAFGRRSAMTTLSGNLTANVARNIWTWAVIFCGHFTEQAHIYTHLADNESKGDWYVRQILGSSNIQGSKWFHLLTGNLSHQIEHHIFPDMPARHYARIAPQVQAICQKYGLSYNTGRFGRQFKQVLGRIKHFSKPSAEEWQAHLQAQSNVPAHTSNVTTPKDEPLMRGLSKYLPPVVQQALFYSK